MARFRQLGRLDATGAAVNFYEGEMGMWTGGRVFATDQGRYADAAGFLFSSVMPYNATWTTTTITNYAPASEIIAEVCHTSKEIK